MFSDTQGRDEGLSGWGRRLGVANHQEKLGKAETGYPGSVNGRGLADTWGLSP